MKVKKLLVFVAIFIASICIFSFLNKVKAVTIADDGEYSLVLSVGDINGDIDGEYCKVVRFNAAEGETTAKLSELTKGVVPFNGETEFSHWETSDKKKVSEELEIANFTSTGSYYTMAGTEVTYTNGFRIVAKFSDKELKGTGTYYLTLDPFAGTINGKSNLRLINKSTEFKTVDLTKYTPVRKGYTFKGWDLNGKIVTSINSSAFANGDAVNVTATYTKDTFEGDDRVLILNANGGTIDGKTSNKYDYLGGGNSGTAMSLLPYVPVREGYKFTGWNTKKDGSGKNYTYIYWRLWDNDGTAKVEKDTIIKNQLGAEYYQNVTLYASWTKNSDTPSEPEQPTKETVKEIKSTGEIEANIEFANEVSKNYKLDIKKVEVKKELADKNIKYMVDINVLDGTNVIKISDTKMKIRIAIPEELKGYNKYEVVYISNDEIKETIPATIEDGYIVFETTHLSEYGIIAKNVENNEKAVLTNETSNPKTADNIMLDVMLFVISIVGIATLAIKK